MWLFVIIPLWPRQARPRGVLATHVLDLSTHCGAATAHYEPDGAPRTPCDVKRRRTTGGGGCIIASSRPRPRPKPRSPSWGPQPWSHDPSVCVCVYVPLCPCMCLCDWPAGCVNNGCGRGRPGDPCPAVRRSSSIGGSVCGRKMCISMSVCVSMLDRGAELVVYHGPHKKSGRLS